MVLKNLLKKIKILINSLFKEIMAMTVIDESLCIASIACIAAYVGIYYMKWNFAKLHLYL